MNSVDFFPLGTVAILVKRMPIVLQLLDRDVSGNRCWSLSYAINDEARDIGCGRIDRVFNCEFQCDRGRWAAVATTVEPQLNHACIVYMQQLDVAAMRLQVRTSLFECPSNACLQIIRVQAVQQ